MSIPLPLIVSLLGFVFTVLTALVGILLKVLNNNTKAIEEMKIYIAKQETADSYEVKACDQRHTYVNKKLGQLSDVAQAHELRLTKLEAK